MLHGSGDVGLVVRRGGCLKDVNSILDQDKGYNDRCDRLGASVSPWFSGGIVFVSEIWG